MTKESKESKSENTIKLALVRVRGLTGVKHDIKDTLENLRLQKKNYCVVVPNTKETYGMIKRVKDYITWGEIDEETYKSLLDVRGKVYTGSDADKKGKINYNKFNVVGDRKLKKIFRLNSPKKGYGRKGIKSSFKDGGALGNRDGKINDLIKRMI